MIPESRNPRARYFGLKRALGRLDEEYRVGKIDLARYLDLQANYQEQLFEAAEQIFEAQKDVPLEGGLQEIREVIDLMVTHEGWRGDLAEEEPSMSGSSRLPDLPPEGSIEAIQMKKVVTIREYFAMALSPIHVGHRGGEIGGDKSIARDFDGIPYIPASSLKGAARAYAALEWDKQECGGSAGACESPQTCPVCVTFGYTSMGTGMRALASFSDARLLLFPVMTDIGPIWVTSPNRLNDTKAIENLNHFDKLRSILSKSVKESPFLISSRTLRKVFAGTELEITPLHLTFHRDMIVDTEKMYLSGIPKEVKERVVFVADQSLRTIVNNNLDLNTSIAVDPSTGAAKAGALYQFEAVPRSSVFWFKISYLSPASFSIDSFTWKENGVAKSAKATMKFLYSAMFRSLKRYETLGVGGMKSRGYGRLKVWDDVELEIKQLLALPISQLRKGDKRHKLESYTEMLRARLDDMKRQRNELEEGLDTIKELLERAIKALD